MKYLAMGLFGLVTGALFLLHDLLKGELTELTIWAVLAVFTGCMGIAGEILKE